MVAVGPGHGPEPLHDTLATAGAFDPGAPEATRSRDASAKCTRPVPVRARVKPPCEGIAHRCRGNFRTKSAAPGAAVTTPGAQARLRPLISPSETPYGRQMMTSSSQAC